MGLLHTARYYGSNNYTTNRFRHAALIRISECIKGVWCHINEATFSVVVEGKTQKIYSSRKMPKLVNRRVGCFVK